MNQFTDIDLFGSYKELINSSYPAFLDNLGLKSAAVKAEGATITDAKGKTYIDCVGGYGIFNVGHNNPSVIKALVDQLNSKQPCTRPFITEIQVRAAELLSEIAPGDLECSFICNSGSEAVDSAIKLARLYSRKKRIITAENSFHGYTFGALSASGISSFKHFFEPLVPEFVQVPYGDSEAIRRSITKDTAAVLLEPIQHEAGVFKPPAEYLPEVWQICKDEDVLLIIDEIKTGMGKAGYMFYCEKLCIIPDILVVGKSLGGGLIPVGALIARRNLWKKFSMSFPMSASSYAGNSLALSATIATIEILRHGNLLEECRSKGDILSRQIGNYCTKYSNVLKSIQGTGLLFGVEAVSIRKAFELLQRMIQQGIIMLPAYGNSAVLMLEPPLVISNEQIQAVLDALDKSCSLLN